MQSTGRQCMTYSRTTKEAYDTINSINKRFLISSLFFYSSVNDNYFVSRVQALAQCLCYHDTSCSLKLPLQQPLWTTTL